MTITTSASKIQEQFWLATNRYCQNIAYNIPLAFLLDKTPDIPHLEKALNMIIEENESLRASFVIEDGILIQKINPIENSTINLRTQQIKHPAQTDLIKQILDEEAEYCFDLSQFPLFRVKLTIFNNSETLLTIVFHHIIIDLISRNVFCNKLSSYYNTLQKEDPISQESEIPQYQDFILWQNNWLSSPSARQKIENWSEKYNKPLEMLDLPRDKQKTKQTATGAKQTYFEIAKDISSQIDDYCRKNEITQFLFLFTCYSVLLQRLSLQEQIIIGVPFTNRMRPQDKTTIGCFVNTLPITIDFSSNPTTSQLIGQIRKEFLFAHRNQEVPLLEIINHIDNALDRSSNPIFQAGFTMEPLATLDFNLIKTEPVVFDEHGSQLDLFLKIIEVKDKIKMVVDFDSEQFEESTIDHWIEIYQQIIHSFLNTTVREVGKLNVLPPHEQNLIKIWNETEVPYEKDLCVHQKLEKIALITPNLPALRFGDSILTYNELNVHSNRLANHLISRGIKVEDIIAVCIDRSMEMMIGIFAILKAGATYLPLDPKYPQDRLSEIISDASPKIVLTNSRSDINLPNLLSTIYVDDIINNPLNNNSSNPESGIRSTNLAYITYTSGSTGKPKGVMIEHHSLMNRLNWMQKEFPLSQTDVLLQKTSITFDVSVWELFWWSFVGASLAILEPGAEREPMKIVNEIHKQKVTVIHFVPSMFSVFIEYLKASQQVKRIVGLKWIFASGEALPPKTVNEFNRLRRYSTLPEIVNLYGPTEATIDVSCYKCPKHENIIEIPIGKTIDNTQLYIINKNNQIQPWGVPGELVIAGVNLARGYFNNQTLTETKFPFVEFNSNIQQTRIYKTGDLAKWNSDGNIIFIGRKDNQIKIRGFRIEMGEIEAKLLKHPKIKEATVLLQNGNDDNPILKAFIIPFPDENIDSIQIKKYLADKLPNYMVPSQIHLIKKMPYSPNGKIDKKALNLINAEKEEPKTTVSSSIENDLISLYAEVLKLKVVNNSDNFFDIGGNSLLAIKLTNILCEKYGIQLEVVKIFEYPTIKDLSEYLSKLDSKNDHPSIAITKTRLEKSSPRIFKRKN